MNTNKIFVTKLRIDKQQWFEYIYCFDTLEVETATESHLVLAQGLTLAKQVLYYLSLYLQPFWGLRFCLGTAPDCSPLTYTSLMPGTTGVCIAPPCLTCLLRWRSH
jgi:hypothetical protein